MLDVTRSRRSRLSQQTGSGIINSLINRLPVELHIPGYQYCGPGTKVIKRVKRGDQGINPLDAACKKHDLAYLSNQDLDVRHKADYELEQSAWKRVKSNDASASEKGAAWLVTNIMKGKQRFGMGVSSGKKSGKTRRRRRVNRRRSGVSKRIPKLAFGSTIRAPTRAVLLKAGGRKNLEKNIMKSTKIALAAARKSVKAAGGKRRIRTPRVIPIPKTGGVLPLIPIFAGLSALGSLAGGAASIVQTIKNIRNSEKTGGSLQLSSKGTGLYLKPYRQGMGLFMNHQQRNSKN